jgi:hypothetical protein
MNPKVKAALYTVSIFGTGMLFSMLNSLLLGWLVVGALVYAMYSILVTKFEMEDSRKSVENPE